MTAPLVANAWHARTVDDVATTLWADPHNGLSTAEAAARQQRYGPNELRPPESEPWWKEALEALTEPLILLLVAVAVIYALLGELEDALTIGLVVAAVVAVEVVNEARGKRAIRALRQLSAPSTTTIRDGRPQDVAVASLVPGDLVLLQPGARVPGDVRLVEATALRIDESSLTGESAPAHKDASAVLPPETELGDRRNMAYAGTTVAAGHGRGLVTATGRATELGRIVGLTERAREPRTPLQQYMRQLAATLLRLALAFSLIVPVLGVLVARRPIQEMVLTGLTLAFATIPEDLPILVTIVLGVGAYQLSRQRAIVRRLAVAETLGSVTVVATDKTGTLTENRMRVAALLTGDALWSASPGPNAATDGAGRRLLEIGVLANEAEPVGRDGVAASVGDPMDRALLAAAEAVFDPSTVRERLRVESEIPFDDRRRRASAIYRDDQDGRAWLVAKGAPEPLLEASGWVRVGERTEPLDEARSEAIHATVERLAERGFRVLAFGERELEPDEPTVADAPEIAEALERDLVFVGLAAFEDPIRADVPAAIDELRAAGVRVALLTGDHPATARAIASELGMGSGRVVLGRDLEHVSDAQLAAIVRDASVFARIAPEHKLRIVRALAAQGAVVAVTGDGVNDAPALREAAIGVAMGETGADVARQAADLVLADDNFATVTRAVRAGRLLFDNLRKGVRYYLATKVALVASSLAAVLVGLPVPFAPVQIILMELLMDLGASLTFAAEPAERDMMARPPRDARQPFMDGALWLAIAGSAAALAAAVVGGYGWALLSGADPKSARTAAFGAWIVGHVVLAAYLRSDRRPPLRAWLLGNRPFLAWAAAALVVLVAAVTVPLARDRLQLAPLAPAAWAGALALAVLLPSAWQLARPALSDTGRRLRRELAPLAAIITMSLVGLLLLVSGARATGQLASSPAGDGAVGPPLQFAHVYVVGFVTFDEGASADEGAEPEGGGGRVATIVVSDMVKPGLRSTVARDQYSLLRTIGLPCLDQPGTANTLAEFFH